MFINKKLFFRRAIAFTLDLYISTLPMLFISLLFKNFPTSYPKLYLVLYSFSFAILLVLRDVIFGSCSLGKKICGLIVIDSGTPALASSEKLIFRGLFCFIYVIEGIVFLLRGSSLSERATGTFVVFKKDYPYL
ncbi:MAG: RDD family protein [Oscillospiraceae bacterium]|nr:RDD family protein [Oscillospiraceae bacterium]